MLFGLKEPQRLCEALVHEVRSLGESALLRLAGGACLARAGLYYAVTSRTHGSS